MLQTRQFGQILTLISTKLRFVKTKKIISVITHDLCTVTIFQALFQSPTYSQS